MGKKKISQLSDRDWEILVTLASGFLPLTNGDVRREMAKAMAAHHDLIHAAKEGVISADTKEGRVSLVVPDSGGLALELESR